MSAFADLNPFADLAEQEKKSNGIAYVRPENNSNTNQSMNAMAAASAGAVAFERSFGTSQRFSNSTAGNISLESQSSSQTNQKVHISHLADFDHLSE